MVFVAPASLRLGYVSFRREDVGSWYVQAIVDVFSQHAHEMDINSLLTMVNRKVMIKTELL